MDGFSLRRETVTNDDPETQLLVSNVAETSSSSNNQNCRRDNTLFSYPINPASTAMVSITSNPPGRPPGQRGRRGRGGAQRLFSSPEMKQGLRQRGTRSREPDTLSSVLLEALSLLRRKDKYAIFHEPVDVLVVPNYLDVIRHPMDFTTMAMKIQNNSYKKFDDFNNDVELIFSNCQVFNPPETIFYKQAVTMHQWWRKICRELQARIEALPFSLPGRSDSTAHISDQKNALLDSTVHLKEEHHFEKAVAGHPPTISLEPVPASQELPRRRLPSIGSKQSSSSASKASTLSEVLQYQGVRGVCERLTKAANCRWDTFTWLIQQLRPRSVSDLVTISHFEARRAKRPRFSQMDASTPTLATEKSSPSNPNICTNNSYSTLMSSIECFLGPHRDIASDLPCVQSLLCTRLRSKSSANVNSSAPQLTTSLGGTCISNNPVYNTTVVRPNYENSSPSNQWLQSELLGATEGRKSLVELHDIPPTSVWSPTSSSHNPSGTI